MAPPLSPTVRAVLADDHPALRAGIRAMLEASASIQVVGEASSGDEALHLVRQFEPDVLLLDMEMPGPDGSGIDGVEVVERLTAQGSPVRTLVFSAYEDPSYVTRVLQAGGAGYITKDKPLELVAEAVMAVARGESRWFVSVSPPTQDLPVSERELDVLRLMSRGNSNAEIAAALFISPNTVRNHVSSIYEKLDVSSWREAVAWAWQRGLVGGP